jgi:hypothetical protein
MARTASIVTSFTRLPCVPVICLLAWALAPARAADTTFSEKVYPVLRQFCFDCHAGAKPKGDLALDKLTGDVAGNAAVWKRVRDQLAEGSMPPKGKPRPGSAETKQVNDWIVAGLKDPRLKAQGRALLRRLNRIEYNNTIRDLLQVDVDLVDLLPEDGKFQGFDNVDRALDLSSTLLERYLEATEVALEAALRFGPRPEVFKKRVNLAQVSRELLAKNKPPLFDDAQTRDDCLVYVKDPPSGPKVIRAVQVPGPGRYCFRICASSFRDPKEQVSMRVYAGYGDSSKGWLAGVFDVTDKPAVVEVSERLLRRDTINICVNGVTHTWNLPKDYAGPGLAVYWVEVEGPRFDAWPPSSTARLLGKVDPDKGTLADAEAILRRFTPRAYRRPVTEAELRPLVDLVKARLERGYRFHEALRVALTAVLCSPDFLYIRSTPGGKLTDYELASRLSYFLWSSMPDDMLLDLANQNRLARPNVLRAQVERMLADPKASAFTENFTGQWLSLRDLKKTDPDRQLYPEFDALLEYSMPRETQLFFEEILRNDLSLLNFVDSSWSILNTRLAEHYGLSGIKKQYFRKVRFPAGSHRGGVLTQASVLKVTANGTNTSPVTRGVWVLDRILGKPVPPPPANVPAIEPDIRGTTTIREQLARHRSSAACASCHNRIDPAGFALESFDVIGGWRDFYRISRPGNVRATKFYDGHEAFYADGPQVLCAGELPGGKKFADSDAFKKLLLEDPDQIARALTTRLLVYATGHGSEPADHDAIEKLVATIRAKDYGFRTLIHEIVQSDAFQNK